MLLKSILLIASCLADGAVSTPIALSRPNTHEMNPITSNYKVLTGLCISQIAAIGELEKTKHDKIAWGIVVANVGMHSFNTSLNVRLIMGKR